MLGTFQPSIIGTPHWEANSVPPPLSLAPFGAVRSGSPLRQLNRRSISQAVFELASPPGDSPEDKNSVRHTMIKPQTGKK